MDSEKELTTLYEELQMLHKMSEEEACDYFNVDYKHEAEQVITDEIAYYERRLNEVVGESADDIEKERQAICDAAGLTRYPMMGYL